MSKSENKDAGTVKEDLNDNKKAVTHKEKELLLISNEKKNKEIIDVFSRKNIEQLSSQIRVTDKDDNGLELFCYIKCNKNDPFILQQCRGVVFNGENIVMKGFPYTIEYNNEDIDELNNKYDIDEYECFESHEGTLLRLFYFNNKWYTTTHRRLNAFRSKWASKESFGTLFKNAIESTIEECKEFREKIEMNNTEKNDNILTQFQSILNKENQYMFLLRNTNNNRIVCDAPEKPTFYHVATIINGKISLDDNICVKKPIKIKFKNWDELCNYSRKCDAKNIQGIICFSKNCLDNTLIHKIPATIKILNKDYQQLFLARGNEPSIKFRYLQVRMDRSLTGMLYYLYPSMSNIFDDYENTIYELARDIYKSYVQRFIKKRYVTVPREEFNVIRTCHSWHLAARDENRISLVKVIEVLNTQSPTNINHMIRRYKSEQLRKKEAGTTRPRKESFHSTKNSPLMDYEYKIDVKSPPSLTLAKSQSFPHKILKTMNKIDKSNMIPKFKRILQRKPV